MAKKTIITAAVTGAWPKKENNPNVPLTPEEIAEDVYDCWLGGDETIKTDDAKFLGVSSVLTELIEVKEAELKKA